MKIKSYAMFAMSGLLTLSLAYITPAMADDTNNSTMPSMQSPSDNTINNNVNSNSYTQNATDSPDANIGTDNNNDTVNSEASSNPSANVGGNEDASPDTTTGDDDY